MSIDARAEQVRDELLSEWEAARLFAGEAAYSHDHYLVEVETTAEGPGILLLGVGITTQKNRPGLVVPLTESVTILSVNEQVSLTTKLQTPLFHVAQQVARFNRAQLEVTSDAEIVPNLQSTGFAIGPHASDIELTRSVSGPRVSLCLLDLRTLSRPMYRFDGIGAENMRDYIENLNHERNDIHFAPAPISYWTSRLQATSQF